jgi:hypothetical protein
MVTLIDLEVIENELAPINVNCSVRVFLRPSIAVRIPTRAIMPNAMIAIVSTALTLFDLIALNATRIFSQNSVKPLTVLSADCNKELRYGFS